MIYKKTFKLSLIISLLALNFPTSAESLLQIETRSKDLTHHDNKTINLLLSQESTRNLNIAKIKITNLNNKLSNLQIELKPGLVINSNLNQFSVDTNETLIWRGDITHAKKNSAINSQSDVMLNYVYIFEKNKRFAGIISLDGKIYDITPTNDYEVAVVEIDSNKFKPEHPPIVREKQNSMTTLEPSFSGRKGGVLHQTHSSPNLGTVKESRYVSRVNVLLLTTYDAFKAIGENNFDVLMTKACILLQQSAINSRVPIQYSTISIVTDIKEEGKNMNALLDSVRNPSTQLGLFAKEQRDKYSADLVSLIVNSSEYCGLGYLTDGSTEMIRDLGFNAVYHNCISNLTVNHELGHNYGMTHDPDNGSNPYFYYGYGFQHTKAPVFRTIMAYECADKVRCPRLNYFSSPDLFHKNIPMGTREKNDNRSVLNYSSYNAAQVYPNKPMRFTESVEPMDYDYIFPDNLSSYAAGTLVKQPKDDKIYQCKPFPYSGFCVQWSETQNQYEPGIGFAWREAWIEK